MATKTFEELKQMAIQIRDEKTNKQNTATRIGTQMVEHLNKLEQEYYNKENIDEQKEQTDAKFSELGNNCNELYNTSFYPSNTIIEVKAEDVLYNNIVLTSSGSTIEVETNEYYTSDYIAVSKNSFISGQEIFRLTEQYCGVALYDSDKKCIAVFGGDPSENGKLNELSLLNYIKVAYLRFTFTAIKSDALFIIKNALAIKNRIKNIENLITGEIVYDKSNIAANNLVLNVDGSTTTTSGDTDYTSDYIEVDKNTVIEGNYLFKKTLNYAGLVLYNRGKQAIYAGGGSGENSSIGVTTLGELCDGDIAYMRFTLLLNHEDAVFIIKDISIKDRVKNVENLITVGRTIIYDKSNIAANNLVLNADGSTTTTSGDTDYTSDYINVNKNTVIEGNYLFEKTFNYAGIVLYNRAKQAIYAGGGSGENSSIGVTTLGELCDGDIAYMRFTLLLNHEDAVFIIKDISIENRIVDIENVAAETTRYDKSNIAANNLVLNADGSTTTTSGDTDYTSDYINVNKDTIVKGNWLFAKTGNFAGIVLYDKEKQAIYAGGGSGQNSSISVTTLGELCNGDIAYMRFTLLLNKDAYVEFSYDKKSKDVLFEIVGGNDIYTNEIRVGVDQEYTTIEAALEAITNPNDKNRYKIIIDEGEYNLDTSRYNCYPTRDYTTIEGVNKDKVIVKAIFSTTVYDASKNTFDVRPQSDTFHYAAFKNMTIICHGGKGAIHIDDPKTSGATIEIDNCLLIDLNTNDMSGIPLSNGNYQAGGINCGISNKTKIYISRCVTNGVIYAHTGGGDKIGQFIFSISDSIFKETIVGAIGAEMSLQNRGKYIFNNCTVRNIYTEDRTDREWEIIFNGKNNIGFFGKAKNSISDEIETFCQDIHKLVYNDSDEEIEYGTLLEYNNPTGQSPQGIFVQTANNGVFAGMAMQRIKARSFGVMQYRGLIDIGIISDCKIGDKLKLKDGHIVKSENEEYIGRYEGLDRYDKYLMYFDNLLW